MHATEARSELIRAVYSVSDLADGHIARAFPLIRDIAGMIGYENWERFARSILEDLPPCRAGISICERQRCIRGMFIWRQVPDLVHERVFLVQQFMVLELLDASAARDAMMSAIVTKAEATQSRIVFLPGAMTLPAQTAGEDPLSVLPNLRGGMA